MSGIFGLVQLDGRPADPGELDRMSAALTHHGGDASRLCLRGAVGMGQHSRWFTPEARLERFPLAGLDDGCLLVLDGRIDDRRDLMARLGPGPDGDGPRDGAEPGDGDLLLRAYGKWGEACVDHVVGVYAFALWDGRARRLVLARSPIAAPALCFRASPGRFAFATMPSGILALPGVPRALDEEHLADVIAVSPGSPPEATLYRGISRLPNGHVVVVGPEGERRRRFWQPDLGRTIRFARDEDYVEAFSELFGRVVGDHLRSSAPVGVMMSGGLDSSAVAVTAARLLQARGERLRAFTEVPLAGFAGAVPEGYYADETPYVQAIARACPSLDLTLVRSEGRTFLDDAERLFHHFEAPMRSSSNRVWLEAILEDARDRGIGVVLDGYQGNLTLSWSGRGLLPGLLRQGHVGSALRESFAMARTGTARSPLRAFVGQGLLPFLPPSVRRAVDRVRGRTPPATAEPWRHDTAIRPAFAAASRVSERAREREGGAPSRSPRDTAQVRYAALAEQDFGPITSAYRSCFGVDVRSPTADVRVAEFCLRLPERQFLRNGESRSLVRRAMAGRLPPLVLANRRRGHQAADWFERMTGVRDRIAAELARLERSDLARRVLDLERMRGMVERWPSTGPSGRPPPSAYNHVLQRGLMVGKFLAWFEGASPAAGSGDPSLRPEPGAH